MAPIKPAAMLLPTLPAIGRASTTTLPISETPGIPRRHGPDRLRLRIGYRPAGSSHRERRVMAYGTQVSVSYSPEQRQIAMRFLMHCWIKRVRREPTSLIQAGGTQGIRRGF